MADDRLPYSLIGGGFLLGGVLLVEAVATALSPGGFQLVVVANIVSSLPFIAVLVGGGYWLLHSDVRTDRYRRIEGWVLASFLFFFLFFVLIAVFTQDALLVQVGILRWAAATGAGVGTLVGLLEATAIERAIAAEAVRVRNDELERQNERLEEFAGIIAHDLRNPLNVAIGNVAIAREDHDDERLDRASSAFDRMERIIEETLTLARSGQVIEEPERVDLSPLVEQCWQNVETAGADLELEGSATFDADPDRLQHLFENLFRNSVEHGSTTPRSQARDDSVEHSSTSSRAQSGDSVEHGGSDVTVRVGPLPDGFYVEDDGPGIPEDERESVLDAGYSTTTGGTGFGLAIANQITSAHGWTLEVTEGTDGGARFEVTGVDTAGAGSSPETASPGTATMAG